MIFYFATTAPGSATLTCSGVPANTTCSVTPSTVTGGSGTAKLVVQTTAPSQTTAKNLMPAGRALPLLAGLLLLFVPKRWRRMRGWLMGLLPTVALVSGALSGCGGSATLAGGTPTETYTFTVTGTAVDGSITLTQNTTVTVKVQSLF